MTQTMRKTLLSCCLVLALVAACSSDNDDVSGSDNGGTSTVTIDSSYTYELPVIFHVLYSDANSSTQYIAYKRLDNILQYVNDIYAGQKFGESENVNIKFVLATKDEQGNKLRYPGVEYVHYTGEYPIDPTAFMNDESGDNVKYIWDPNSYINVMMYNFKPTGTSETLLGISHMPYCVAGHEIAGLSKATTASISKENLDFAYCSSINSLYAAQGNVNNGGGYYQSNRYTGENVTQGYQTIEPRDIVVTLAHELGHYLGLFHAFTEKVTGDGSVPVDSCGDTDYCADTKSYNYYEYQSYLEYLAARGSATADEVLTRYSCDSVKYESDNIMDYSYTLGYQISPEQKERIRNVLYYSPLMPGPKKNRNNNTTRATTGKVKLKITTMK